jgi:hypothetical protein
MAPAERAEFALRRRSQASFLTDPDGGDEEYELEYAGGKVYDHQVKYAENVFGGLAIAEPESPSSERFRG